MLKKIPKIISPELMKYMMEMGHSDILILADANFPAISNAKRYLRLDNVEIDELLPLLLEFYPLDSFVEKPVSLMQHLPEEPRPKIWDVYESTIKSSEEKEAFSEFNYIERLNFYEEAKKAYVIVQTAATKRYANIMLQKGVI